MVTHADATAQAALDRALAAISDAVEQAAAGPARNPVPRVRVAQAVDAIVAQAVEADTAHSPFPRSEARLSMFVSVADDYIRDRAAEAEAVGGDPAEARRAAAALLHCITRHLGGDAR